MFRWLILILLLLLAGLQYRLWFGEASVRDIWQLDSKIKLQQNINQSLEQRNNELEAEISDLKKGKDALEEQARNELGMIRKGETFFQLIEPTAEEK